MEKQLLATEQEERMLKKQLKKVNDDYRAAKRQLDGTQFACFTRYKSTNTDAQECRVTELNHEKAVLDERTHELQVLTQDSGFSLLALLAQKYKILQLKHE